MNNEDQPSLRHGVLEVCFSFFYFFNIFLLNTKKKFLLFESKQFCSIFSFLSIQKYNEQLRETILFFTSEES
jgi:hypothetical protein